MKLQECREALKIIPIGDPRRGKILEEMERIKKWMISQGYGKKSGGNYSTASATKIKCKHCGWDTLPIPVKTEKCSACGKFYNEI